MCPHGDIALDSPSHIVTFPALTSSSYLEDPPVLGQPSVASPSCQNVTYMPSPNAPLDEHSAACPISPEESESVVNVSQNENTSRQTVHMAPQHDPDLGQIGEIIDLDVGEELTSKETALLERCPLTTERRRRRRHTICRYSWPHCARGTGTSFISGSSPLRPYSIE